jgi:hypothetical protein
VRGSKQEKEQFDKEKVSLQITVWMSKTAGN